MFRATPERDCQLRTLQIGAGYRPCHCRERKGKASTARTDFKHSGAAEIGGGENRSRFYAIGIDLIRHRRPPFTGSSRQLLNR
jgi:hypothetical protein